ncbi:MAG: ribosome small subunit-dependent GTPase A, partial [Planctomycetota bacterium]|nr:ribosome small subunit-dependent GTPase A [Planctomycetota bacterium]
APLEPLVAAGVQVVACSAESGEGVADLEERLAGRTCVFVGHSGVGKSSLLNALDPELGIKVSAVRESDGKGRHTTSASTLHRLPCGARVIDTPGVREFGLWNLSAEELAGYFPELAKHAAGCRFRDCSHDHEPDCAVRAAVASGGIPAARWRSYLRIRATLKG